MKLISTTELAELAGVSKSAISQAKSNGRIRPMENGKYDIENTVILRFISEAKENKKNWSFDHTLLPTTKRDTGETSQMDVFATFEGKEQIVISHAYTSDDLELDPVVYPVPVAVRIEYSKNVRVFTLDGIELPSRIEVTGSAKERTSMMHAIV